jgi:Na+-transporting methylmalonyl-CoA/oxaloacetate decarboxylase gamma subunit
MIDWNLVAEVAGGGFGITILVLVILSVVAWLVGLIITKTRAKPEDTAAKDK